MIPRSRDHGLTSVTTITELNGDSYPVLRGLIEGLDVEVNGNGFQMHGTGESSDEELILVE